VAWAISQPAELDTLRGGDSEQLFMARPQGVDVVELSTLWYFILA